MKEKSRMMQIEIRVGVEEKHKWRTGGKVEITLEVPEENIDLISVEPFVKGMVQHAYQKHLIELANTENEEE